MGWKGTLRSLEASHNRSVRAAERRSRQEQKEQDKINKKLQKIEDNREKVHLALKNDFAADKITKEEYDELEKRMADITDELLVFGKTPAVTLGKKYVCGKINKEKFDAVRAELVPSGFDEEHDTIMKTVEQKQKQQEEFLSACEAKEKACAKCGKQKKWYSLFGTLNDMSVCSECLEEYKTYSKYEGFNGEYLMAEPCEVTQEMQLRVSLK